MTGTGNKARSAGRWNRVMRAIALAGLGLWLWAALALALAELDVGAARP